MSLFNTLVVPEREVNVGISLIEVRVKCVKRNLLERTTSISLFVPEREVQVGVGRENIRVCVRVLWALKRKEVPEIELRHHIDAAPRGEDVEGVEISVDACLNVCVGCGRESCLVVVAHHARLLK
jgi:hypothetical protein